MRNLYILSNYHPSKIMMLCIPKKSLILFRLYFLNLSSNFFKVCSTLTTVCGTLLHFRHHIGSIFFWVDLIHVLLTSSFVKFSRCIQLYIFKTNVFGLFYCNLAVLFVIPNSKSLTVPCSFH